jgi:hypothetical protein
VPSAAADVRVLESLLPSEHGLRVFDAETQETSYGIWSLEGVPYIFDTHRSEGRFVATIELLTEVVQPIRIGPMQVRQFSGDARRIGLLPIPYSGCFFKGNLHVYAFSGPVRGFDLAAVGRSVPESERRLRGRVESLRRHIPKILLRAQHELLEGRRRVRHAADREVLVLHARKGRTARFPERRRRSSETSRL